MKEFLSSEYLTSKYLIPAAVVLLVLVLTGGGYFYFQAQKSNKETSINNPQTAQEEAKKIVAEVGKLIDLPTGEDPTIATVTDITKLKDQPFFAKAKNGDKVLIYTNAKKAILYDPTQKKVIDIAPINIGSSSAQASGAKIVLRNGTNVTGLTSRVEGEIKKIQPQINIITRENAKKFTFDKTIIVILNPLFKDTANSLLGILKGASLGDLPEGEDKPKDGDVLIILGTDRT